VREKLKANAHPIFLPIGKEENFTGLIDLVQNVAYLFEEDPKDQLGMNPKTVPVPAEMVAQTKEYRDKLIEAVSDYDDVKQALHETEVKLEEAERQLVVLRAKLAAAIAANHKLHVAQSDVATLRETMDKLKDKLKSAAIVLAAVNDGKVSLIAGVTADATARVKAGELVNFVAQQVGGKGGGRPDMAQAGGTDPSGLDKALQGVGAWVSERV